MRTGRCEIARRGSSNRKWNKKASSLWVIDVNPLARDTSGHAAKIDLPSEGFHRSDKAIAGDEADLFFFFFDYQLLHLRTSKKLQKEEPVQATSSRVGQSHCGKSIATSPKTVIVWRKSFGGEKEEKRRGSLGSDTGQDFEKKIPDGS
jgi:hypothetical protein